MTKIYLITGFLGAGKSTYLNNLLSRSNKKTGVLINEFGKISVDTITLNKSGMELVELKNGSIFCACLKDKFVDGLIELLKMELDEIYIESSGLSDPSNMNNIAGVLKKQVSDKEFQLSGVICILDAVYFLKQLDVLESVRRQIVHSHFIIINKTDLVDEEQIEKIKKRIISINPKAQIECASFGKSAKGLEDFTVFNIASQDTTNTVESRPYSMMLEFASEPDMSVLKQFFSDCSDYLYRAKGYVKIKGQLYKVDTVNDLLDIEKADKSVEIDEADVNKVVLLASKGIESVKYISKKINEDLKGFAKLSS